MADFEAKISKSGIIDQKATYEAVASFFKGKEFDINEDKYSHKKGSYKGHNISHEWTAELDTNKYTKIKFEVKMELNDAYDVEVVIDGKKQVMTKANINIKIEGNLEKDKSKKFDTPFKEKLKKIYERTLGGGETKKYKDYTGDLGKELYKIMKEKLEFEASKNG